MGMYTELIFGAELKKDTPNQVIEALKYMIGETKEKPSDFPLPDGRCERLFQGGSYYFAINNSATKMWLDDIDEQWHISTRSNIKNYESEIETFLEWIKPYIDSGSGGRDLYAITIYEEQDTPSLYYLYDAD
jgi:hypothetical protein